MLKHRDTGILYGFNAPKAELACMEVVEVDADDATPVAKPATPTVTKTDVPTRADARMAAIIKAIRSLDRNNSESFTQTGKPKVPAIEYVLGYDITASERDEAYSAITEQ